MADWSRIFKPTLSADINSVVESSMVDWAALRGCRIFVTGATGLLGGLICKVLFAANLERKLNLRVIAAVRDMSNVDAILLEMSRTGTVDIVQWDANDSIVLSVPVDYVIHAASPTASKFFSENPVETFSAIVSGTRHVLELARSNKIKAMVYLSSMEVYGETNVNLVRESDLGYVNPLLPRSSYPIGKRAAECLCANYFAEYGVPVVIARLAQVFGPGVRKTDNRVFMQFARAILHGTDIRLRTDGSRAYGCCYTTDAITGILRLLQLGKRGEAYNVVNESTFMSIREIAERLIKTYPTSGSRLLFETSSPFEKSVFPPSSQLNLTAAKLHDLGWQPMVGLDEMYKRLMSSIKEDVVNEY